MLERDPWLADYDVRTALVLGDAARVRALLAGDPGLTTRTDEQTGWTALHAACASRWPRPDPARAGGLSLPRRIPVHHPPAGRGQPAAAAATQPDPDPDPGSSHLPGTCDAASTACPGRGPGRGRDRPESRPRLELMLEPMAAICLLPCWRACTTRWLPPSQPGLCSTQPIPAETEISTSAE
jgi:hypothetical protein